MGETLGDEARGMVVVDFDGHPQKYDGLKILSDAVAKEINILRVDVPRVDGGRGWTRTHLEISTGDSALGEGWLKDISSGAKYIIEESWVKANDPHYDAKVWPALHPHGTGSVRCEMGAGSLQAHARNRALCLQSHFRRTALWAFWMLDRMIKNDLFSLNSCGRRRDRGAGVSERQDTFTKNFGSAVPDKIPESSAWWRKQSKNLMAITEEGELGTSRFQNIFTGGKCKEISW